MMQNGFKIHNPLHFCRRKSKNNTILLSYDSYELSRENLDNDKEMKPLGFSLFDCSLSLNLIEVTNFIQQHTNEPAYDPP